jgi:hypothetical protein
MSEEKIKEQAEKIREKLKDGSIFGIPSDIVLLKRAALPGRLFV